MPTPTRPHILKMPLPVSLCHHFYSNYHSVSLLVSPAFYSPPLQLSLMEDSLIHSWVLIRPIFGQVPNPYLQPGRSSGLSTSICFTEAHAPACSLRGPVGVPQVLLSVSHLLAEVGPKDSTCILLQRWAWAPAAALLEDRCQVTTPSVCPQTLMSLSPVNY